MLPNNIISVSLFGSVARGDYDDNSDADVLVIVSDETGKTSDELIYSIIPDIGSLKPTVSWYGESRMRQMFQDGHLFAWHLFRETRHIYGDIDLKSKFGEPTPYQSVAEDVSSFESVLIDIPAALKFSPHNLIYEMGLQYVCLRNIAMSASWHLLNQPDFTRFSPYNLGELSFTGSKHIYDLSISCRMSSQRGSKPIRPVKLSEIIELNAFGLKWVRQLKKELNLN